MLAGVSCNTVKLITDIGAAPSCAVGSTCNCGFRHSCRGGLCYSGCCNTSANYVNNCLCHNRGSSLLGSITEIPVEKIVSFVHNAI